MFVINGQFPGPLIEANEGDTIVVNVHNDMSNGTGIRKYSYQFFAFSCPNSSLIDWRQLFFSWAGRVDLGSYLL